MEVYEESPSRINQTLSALTAEVWMSINTLCFSSEKLSIDLHFNKYKNLSSTLKNFSINHGKFIEQYRDIRD
ncbi:MAG: hypothetical protein MHPSP_000009, partial [Paramarteilia canceri]